MAEKKMRLKIITPEKVKVDEDVRMVVMRATTGDMGVLPGHMPYSAVLDYGVLRIIDGETERKIAVYGGLAVTQNSVLTILTSDAEWPEEIDLARANLDREHAQQRLREKLDDMEIQHDEILLRRALVRIEINLTSLADPEE